MREYREGERVLARVAGFLPGRRVMLDLDGETVLAVSDLPLVRGRLITARVERPGGALRFRVTAEAEPETLLEWGAAAPPAGAKPDGLDRAIARLAREWGIGITRSFLDEVRREIVRADADLAKGNVVPLEKAEREAERIVAALARGLDPTARSLAALGADGEARLGTALDRLEKALRETARFSGGEGGRWTAAAAEKLRRFFVDLDGDSVAEAIARGIRRSGYAYEEKLARRGASGWEDREAAAAEIDEDLKGFLLMLHRRLGRLRERPPSRENAAEARRTRETALAWTARALDRIESFQVGNLPGPDGSGRTAEFQLPVRAGGRTGTLHLFFSEEKSRCWLDAGEGEPLGLETDGGEDPPVLRVFPASEEDASPERAERIRERIARAIPGARVRIDASPASRTAAADDPPSRPVDLSI